VFKDPKVIDIVSYFSPDSLFCVLAASLFKYFKNLLPEPILPQEESKTEEKSTLKDTAKTLTGGLSNLLGGNKSSDKNDNKK
jgi:hypothetical protein